jgi:hypothetical protein
MQLTLVVTVVLSPHHLIHLGVFILFKRCVHNDSFWFCAGSLFFSLSSTSICAMPKITLALQLLSFLGFVIVLLIIIFLFKKFISN